MHCPRDSLESIALDLGDCIGLESCVDLRTDIVEEDFSMVQNIPLGGARAGGRKRLGEVEKEYPPPIPWLARTENLPSHMPWIMKRYYTNDGRLIIKEEKVKRHEYFQAHRSNGRLTLHLVPLNDELDDDHEEEEGPEDKYREVEYDQDSDISGREMNGFDGGREEKVCREHTVMEEESRESKRVYSESCMDSGAPVISGGGAGGGGGGRGKCYEYSSMSRRSCWRFGMGVAAIRPVHT